VLQPYLINNPERVRMYGPKVPLPPRLAVVLAMILHEIATNAAKYGALSLPEGRIAVRWHLQRSARPILRIEWRERDGPPVQEPERRGFGSRFIEGSVAAELRGTAKLAFERSGLVCTMEIPFDAAKSPAEDDKASDR
jgi:two-component sensor histidine kinase